MINYDKSEIREQLNIENIFELLQEWGGDPEYTSFGIISATICHNEPGEGSHKLYYYLNSGLFQCYTGCQGYFDVFELTRKVAQIQWNEEYDLNDAVRWIARRFGISGRLEDGEESDKIEDWKLLASYDRIKEIELKEKTEIVLKEYDTSILDRFNYSVKITPWLMEGISQTALDQAKIGFYPGGDQITIPHFDSNGRLIKDSTIELDGNKYTFDKDGKLRNVVVENPDTIVDNSGIGCYSVDDYGNDDLECDFED